MTHKQIEASREARLWIGQIIVPAATLATTIIIANPEIRKAIAKTATNVKNSICNKFRRKEKEATRKIEEKKFEGIHIYYSDTGEYRSKRF